MATYTGQLGAVLLGVNPIAEIRAFEITAVSDTIDDTVMGDTWKTNKATHKSWSGSMDVLFDHTNTNGQNALIVGASLTGSFYPSQNLAAQAELVGPLIVTERAIKSAHEGLVEMTVSFIGNGALVEGVKA